MTVRVKFLVPNTCYVENLIACVFTVKLQ